MMFPGAQSEESRSIFSSNPHVGEGSPSSEWYPFPMRITLIALAILSLTMPGWADPAIDRALEIARQEWDRFGNQTIDIEGTLVKKGGQENEEGYYMRVADYWKEGVDRDLTGKDTHEPWSAAFISWVMKKAGMGERFSYSDWHAHYIRNSIRHRRVKDKSFAFWGYRLSERAPQVGDLVGYARQNGVSYDYQPTVYSSHTDLVVAVRAGEIDVIGGNVKNSVSLKTLRTDENGFLIDKNYRWFVVMAPTR